MKNPFVLSFFMLFFSVNAIAQAASEASKAELRNLLQETSSFAADFTQIVSNEMNEVLQESQGKMYLGKPNKLRWELSFPDETLSIADGKAVYNIDPFLEQVSIVDQETIVGNNPLALLLNDELAQWEKVKVTKKDDVFVIIPLAEDGNISELQMQFDENKQLSLLQAKDRQGQINTIRFTNKQTNPMLSFNLFVPPIPEGFIIDDQR